MKHFHCPVNGWDCPYYKDEPNHLCVCTMEKPYEDCDDFIGLYDSLAEGIGEITPDDYTDDHEVKDICCPSCGAQLIEEEREDTMYNKYTIELEKCGKCEKCGKRYYYYEEYEFKRVYSFTEAY